MNLTCQPNLKWPTGYTRTPPDERRWSAFGSRRANGSYGREQVSIADALSRLREQLSAFTRLGHPCRTADEVVTANLPVGVHGAYKSNTPEPADRGVAVYFELDGKPIVLCCDKWNRVACNLVAISKTLEAMRGLERWGVTECDRAFTGFAALPETASVPTCWQVLGIERTKDTASIDAAFKVKAKTAHPDLGGSSEAFDELARARDQALADARS